LDLAVAADLINAAAVVAAVLFAATQIRDYRKQRRRDAMLELVLEKEASHPVVPAHIAHRIWP
jgi:hypothetical protein